MDAECQHYRSTWNVSTNKLVEAQRIEQRTRFDIEMLNELGFCKGIENYTRHISGAMPAEPPPPDFELPPEVRANPTVAKIATDAAAKAATLGLSNEFRQLFTPTPGNAEPPATVPALQAEWQGDFDVTGGRWRRERPARQSPGFARRPP